MYPNNQSKNKKGLLIGIAVMAVVVIATIMGEKRSAAPDITNNQTSSAATETPIQDSGTPLTLVTTPPVDSNKKTSSVYKDGTYSATGSYMSPGGEDQLAVTLTLANDIITDVSVTPTAGDRTSQRYQDRFISGYKQYVVGKNIAEVNLTNISGSSLTPIGFDAALAKIKAQAKA